MQQQRSVSHNTEVMTTVDNQMYRDSESDDVVNKDGHDHHEMPAVSVEKQALSNADDTEMFIMKNDTLVAAVELTQTKSKQQTIDKIGAKLEQTVHTEILDDSKGDIDKDNKITETTSRKLSLHEEDEKNVKVSSQNKAFASNDKANLFPHIASAMCKLKERHGRTAGVKSGSDTVEDEVKVSSTENQATQSVGREGLGRDEGESTTVNETLNITGKTTTVNVVPAVDGPKENTEKEATVVECEHTNIYNNVNQGYDSELSIASSGYEKEKANIQSNKEANSSTAENIPDQSSDSSNSKVTYYRNIKGESDECPHEIKKEDNDDQQTIKTEETNEGDKCKNKKEGHDVSQHGSEKEENNADGTNNILQEERADGWHKIKKGERDYIQQKIKKEEENDDGEQKVTEMENDNRNPHKDKDEDNKLYKAKTENIDVSQQNNEKEGNNGGPYKIRKEDNDNSPHTSYTKENDSYRSKIKSVSTSRIPSIYEEIKEAGEEEFFSRDKRKHMADQVKAICRSDSALYESNTANTSSFQDSSPKVMFSEYNNNINPASEESELMQQNRIQESESGCDSISDKHTSEFMFDEDTDDDGEPGEDLDILNTQYYSTEDIPEEYIDRCSPVHHLQEADDLTVTLGKDNGTTECNRSNGDISQITVSKSSSWKDTANEDRDCVSTASSGVDPEAFLLNMQKKEIDATDDNISPEIPYRTNEKDDTGAEKTTSYTESSHSVNDESQISSPRKDKEIIGGDAGCISSSHMETDLKTYPNIQKGASEKTQDKGNDCLSPDSSLSSIKNVGHEQTSDIECNNSPDGGLQISYSSSLKDDEENENCENLSAAPVEIGSGTSIDVKGIDGAKEELSSARQTPSAETIDSWVEKILLDSLVDIGTHAFSHSSRDSSTESIIPGHEITNDVRAGVLNEDTGTTKDTIVTGDIIKPDQNVQDKHSDMSIKAGHVNEGYQSEPVQMKRHVDKDLDMSTTHHEKSSLSGEDEDEPRLSVVESVNPEKDVNEYSSHLDEGMKESLRELNTNFYSSYDIPEEYIDRVVELEETGRGSCVQDDAESETPDEESHFEERDRKSEAEGSLGDPGLPKMSKDWSPFLYFRKIANSLPLYKSHNSDTVNVEADKNREDAPIQYNVAEIPYSDDLEQETEDMLSLNTKYFSSFDIDDEYEDRCQGGIGDLVFAMPEKERLEEANSLGNIQKYIEAQPLETYSLDHDDALLKNGVPNMTEKDRVENKQDCVCKCEGETKRNENGNGRQDNIYRAYSLTCSTSEQLCTKHFCSRAVQTDVKYTSICPHHASRYVGTGKTCFCIKGHPSSHCASFSTCSDDYVEALSDTLEVLNTKYFSCLDIPEEYIDRIALKSDICNMVDDGDAVHKTESGHASRDGKSLEAGENKADDYDNELAYVDIDDLKSLNEANFSQNDIPDEFEDRMQDQKKKIISSVEFAKSVVQQMKGAEGSDKSEKSRAHFKPMFDVYSAIVEMKNMVKDKNKQKEAKHAISEARKSICEQSFKSVDDKLVQGGVKHTESLMTQKEEQKLVTDSFAESMYHNVDALSMESSSFVTALETQSMGKLSVSSRSSTSTLTTVYTVNEHQEQFEEEENRIGLCGEGSRHDGYFICDDDLSLVDQSADIGGDLTRPRVSRSDFTLYRKPPVEDIIVKGKAVQSENIYIEKESNCTCRKMYLYFTMIFSFVWVFMYFLATWYLRTDCSGASFHVELEHFLEFRHLYPPIM